ncbi:hypothetical protein P775_14720 [Puniceibacterium antarcticum]|uniref:Uncharacterized protein n=1 Tax=Puniceibacterium antarcticum TaxID=1206336 RepID=A0A2G8RCY7_9RHOB|nr:hypothetical protein P775_14720 [Puniceibacterium antarcticum]
MIVTSFVLGMAVGTFFTGPLSDTFGHNPVVVAGAFKPWSWSFWLYPWDYGSIGTSMPLAVGIIFQSVLACALMLKMRRSINASSAHSGGNR